MPRAVSRYATRRLGASSICRKTSWPGSLFEDVLEEFGELDSSAPSSTIEFESDRPDALISRTVNTRDGRHVGMNSRRMHLGYTIHIYTDATGYVHSNEKLRVAMQGMTSAQEQLNAEMQPAYGFHCDLAWTDTAQLPRRAKYRPPAHRLTCI